MEDKKALRAKLLAKREEMSDERISEISGVIFEKVKRLYCFAEAATIMVYVTYGKELNTFGFIQDCIKLGKRVVTPICKSDHTMLLALTTSFPEGFERTKMGILEIPKERAVAIDASEVDLVVTPGLAFTLDGDRLGYGGGYYDRLFDRLPERTSLVCPSFDDFILPSVPTEAHDHKVDIILTERRSIFCGRKREEKPSFEINRIYE